MKINELFTPFDSINIKTYLGKYGITDTEKYLHPTKECFEPVKNYDGMKEGYDMLKEHLGNRVSFMLIDEVND